MCNKIFHKGKIKFKHFLIPHFHFSRERMSDMDEIAESQQVFPQRLKREFTIPRRIELFGFLAVFSFKRGNGWERRAYIKWRQCWEFFGTGSPDSRESTIFSRTANLFLDARRPKNRRVRVFLDRVFAPLELLYRFFDYPSRAVIHSLITRPYFLSIHTLRYITVIIPDWT